MFCTRYQPLKHAGNGNAQPIELPVFQIDLDNPLRLERNHKAEKRFRLLVFTNWQDKKLPNLQKKQQGYEIGGYEIVSCEMAGPDITRGDNLEKIGLSKFCQDVTGTFPCFAMSC